MNNDNFTRIASNYTKRKTKFGYLGIISDVYMLSKCDYLVCTFSSNVRVNLIRFKIVYMSVGSYLQFISNSKVSNLNQFFIGRTITQCKVSREKRRVGEKPISKLQIFRSEFNIGRERDTESFQQNSQESR